VTVLDVVVPDSYDDPARPSGGNVYDRRLCAELAALGWAVRVRRVPGAWPDAGPDGARDLAAALAAVPDGAVALVDGLLGSGHPEALMRESARLRLVALVHLPFGSVEPTDGPTGRQVRDREAWALGCCDAVVTTSRWSRDWVLDHYRLAPDRVVVAVPGVDAAPVAARSATGDRLLCVGAVTPVKGHDLLVDALAAVGDLEWTCTCVGSVDVDADFARQVAARVEAHSFGRRVRMPGPLTGARLDAAYADADLLVLPSRVEAYGMVVIEALARAIPVVAGEVGGVPEALGVADTRDGERAETPGLLVPPDDPAALARALRDWLTDPGLRERLRRRAVARRAGLSPWSDPAAAVADLLATVAESRPRG
jgi:glycosyltransferase involved in cell wall biosynthesis